ncbi:MAG: glycoside hydrolase family 99-like domain-containing protein, partial [Acidimicrobiales bacterium]|nr:glycoside hydrolase family 99-like domain-containing protein [Acidimicrobiales bacterium]
VVELGLRRVGHRARLQRSPYRRHIRVAYDRLVADALGAPDPGYTRYPCVVPSWDNSARRDYGAVIVEGSTPGAYERWVRAALADEPDLLFVNAWNEWGEGCHLEPDQRWGRAFLEAHLAAVNHADAS